MGHPAPGYYHTESAMSGQYQQMTYPTAAYMPPTAYGRHPAGGGGGGKIAQQSYMPGRLNPYARPVPVGQQPGDHPLQQIQQMPHYYYHQPGPYYQASMGPGPAPWHQPYEEDPSGKAAAPLQQRCYPTPPQPHQVQQRPMPTPSPQPHQVQQGPTPTPPPQPHQVQRPTPTPPPQPHQVQQRTMPAPSPQPHQIQQRPTPTPPAPHQSPAPSAVSEQLSEAVRLNFPIRDGTILQPFRLDHNLAVSHYQFELRPDVFNTLMNRPDLELQLKSQMLDDRSGQCSWPKQLTISVNSQPVTISRPDRPLHVKSLCSGSRRNVLQLAVTACCCSYQFTMQLVHRPSVHSVIQGLWRKRRLPTDSCMEKIRRFFADASSQEGGEGFTCVTVSLRCPVSLARIDLPARGSECRHTQCFDLRSYLLMNADRCAWKCPLCGRPALLEGLEVDEYLFGLLEETRSAGEIDRVVIDSRARWRPLLPPPPPKSPACVGVKLEPAQQLHQPPQQQPSSTPTPSSSSSQPAVQRSPLPSNLSSSDEPRTPLLPPLTPDFPNISSMTGCGLSGGFGLQQPGTPMTACPPTNASCSTTDPASVRTDLDDLNLDPLGGEPGSIAELLSYLDSA